VRFVICYDIADDGRRNRLATGLLDFGQRIQESVFLATLDEELSARMEARIERLIDPMQDCVHIFEICAACEKRIKVMGRAELPKDEDFYVV
jgi:CRISPR-associated protein Cas2